MNSSNRAVHAAAALSLAALAAAGCTGGGTPAAPAPSVTAATPGVSPEMPRFLTAADDANAEGPTTVIRAGARPTVVEENSRVQTMVIRDESSSSFAKGDYRLVVRCAGAGTLYAHFAIGKASTIEELKTCGTPTATTSAVSLSVPTDADRLSVIIMPIGNAQAAVAYQVQRQ